MVGLLDVSARLYGFLIALILFGRCEVLLVVVLVFSVFACICGLLVDLAVGFLGYAVCGCEAVIGLVV